jgi:uncharacterized protein (DUF4415 family)
MSEAELEVSITSDPDRKAPRGVVQERDPRHPRPQATPTLRLDPEIIAWFRAKGPGYQPRMNAVLRADLAAASPRPPKSK